MNKAEAQQALKDGERIRHSGFADDEWMEKGGIGYVFEDGATCTFSEFWYFRTEEWWDKGWAEA